jgi:hypothetical protein
VGFESDRLGKVVRRSGIRVEWLKFRVWGLGFRFYVWGLGFRVQGSGFRV